MATACPRCGLVNPPGSQRCDCGYSLASRAGEPVTLTARDRALLVGRLVSKGGTVLLILSVVALVQMFRVGVNYRHALLLVGSLVSLAALFAYPARAAMEHGRPQRSLAGFLIGLVVSSRTSSVAILFSTKASGASAHCLTDSCFRCSWYPCCTSSAATPLCPRSTRPASSLAPSMTGASDSTEIEL